MFSPGFAGTLASPPAWPEGGWRSVGGRRLGGGCRGKAGAARVGRSAGSWLGGPQAGGPAGAGRGGGCSHGSPRGAGPTRGAREAAATRLPPGRGGPAAALRGEGRPCLTSGGGARPGGPCLRPAGCWGRAQCTARLPCPLSPCRSAAERPGRPRVWPVTTEQRVGRGRPQTAGWATRGRKEGGRRWGWGGEGTSCLRRVHRRQRRAPAAQTARGARSAGRAPGGRGARARRRGGGSPEDPQ